MKTLIITAYLALALSACVTSGKETPPKAAPGLNSAPFGAPVTRTLPETGD